MTTSKGERKMSRQPPMQTHVISDFIDSGKWEQETKIIFAEEKKNTIDYMEDCDNYYVVETVDQFGCVRKYLKDIVPGKITTWDNGRFLF